MIQYVHCSINCFSFSFKTFKFANPKYLIPRNWLCIEAKSPMSDCVWLGWLRHDPMLVFVQSINIIPAPLCRTYYPRTMTRYNGLICCAQMSKWDTKGAMTWVNVSVCPMISANDYLGRHRFEFVYKLRYDYRLDEQSDECHWRLHLTVFLQTCKKRRNSKLNEL